MLDDYSFHYSYFIDEQSKDMYPSYKIEENKAFANLFAEKAAEMFFLGGYVKGNKMSESKNLLNDLNYNVNYLFVI